MYLGTSCVEIVNNNNKEHIKWDICERTVFCFGYI